METTRKKNPFPHQLCWSCFIRKCLYSLWLSPFESPYEICFYYTQSQAVSIFLQLGKAYDFVDSLFLRPLDGFLFFLFLFLFFCGGGGGGGHICSMWKISLYVCRWEKNNSAKWERLAVRERYSGNQVGLVESVKFEKRLEEHEKLSHVLSAGRVCPVEGIARAKALRQKHD